MARKSSDSTQSVIRPSILNQFVFLLIAICMIGCSNNLDMFGNEYEVFGPDPAMDNITIIGAMWFWPWMMKAMVA